MPESSRHSTGLVVPQHGLRHYQIVTARKIFEQLQEKRRVLLHAPTGSGKTRTAISVVTMHMRRQGPTTVLWLVSAAHLVTQAAEAFKKAWVHHGDINAMLVEWRGDATSFAEEIDTDRNTFLAASLQIVISTVQTHAECLDMLRRKISLIVFDEAHQSVAPSYRELVAEIMRSNEQSQLLGLSATPGRAQGEEETRALTHMYGYNKVTITEGNPIQYLVREGFMAEAIFCRHTLDSMCSSRAKVDGKYDNAAMKELGKDIDRNTQIVNLVSTIINDYGHKRILVFTPSVLSAYTCARSLKENHGINYSNTIEGNTPDADRKHIMETFSCSCADISQPQVIFNCQVLAVGVDLPNTDAVLIAQPTKSPVLYQQIIGRALRGPKSGGTEKAYIHTLVDENFPEFDNLVKLFTKWDELWDPTN